MLNLVFGLVSQVFDFSVLKVYETSLKLKLIMVGLEYKFGFSFRSKSDFFLF